MKIEHEESLGNTIACMHHVYMLNDLNIHVCRVQYYVHVVVKIKERSWKVDPTKLWSSER